MTRGNATNGIQVNVRGNNAGTSSNNHAQSQAMYGPSPAHGATLSNNINPAYTRNSHSHKSTGQRHGQGQSLGLYTSNTNGLRVDGHPVAVNMKGNSSGNIYGSNKWSTVEDTQMPVAQSRQVPVLPPGNLANMNQADTNTVILPQQLLQQSVAMDRVAPLGSGTNSGTAALPPNVTADTVISNDNYISSLVSDKLYLNERILSEHREVDDTSTMKSPGMGLALSPNDARKVSSFTYGMPHVSPQDVMQR